MFAVAQQASVQVYNFYSGESPAHFLCKGHTQRVRSICWFQDDTGFVSAGQGGEIYFWDLINAKDGNPKLGEKDYNQKNVQMTTVVAIPDK